MITVQKQEVGNWLLIEYLSTLYNVKEKLRFFEQRHNNSFESFEKQVKLSEQENFTLWDDYIEWKAYMKVANELSVNIKKVKHGNFKVA
ncbi:hypothetical protein MHK_004514 [Candidatus Magnetomorum sp. HK-1]|nr:hypothetical protein MHK_004514 [Candidatus Magnetomorum sp. HK-1]